MRLLQGAANFPLPPAALGQQNAVFPFPMKRFAPFALAGLLALLLPACQSPGPHGGVAAYPQPGAEWKTSLGQLRYQNPNRSVIGEAIVSRHGAEQFQLDYLAGPGVPLLRLREAGPQADAEGVFAWGTWRGKTARPGRMASWTTLREIFAALDARPGPMPEAASPAGKRPAWTARAERKAGKLRRVEISYPEREERLTFVFAR